MFWKLRRLFRWPWKWPHVFHNYEILLSEIITEECEKILFRKPPDLAHMLRWEKCQGCEKQRVFLISIDGKQTKIEPTFVKAIDKVCRK
jgi:hypothetical protein